MEKTWTEKIIVFSHKFSLISDVLPLLYSDYIIVHGNYFALLTVPTFMYLALTVHNITDLPLHY